MDKSVGAGKSIELGEKAEKRSMPKKRIGKMISQTGFNMNSSKPTLEWTRAHCQFGFDGVNQ